MLKKLFCLLLIIAGCSKPPAPVKPEPPDWAKAEFEFEIIRKPIAKAYVPPPPLKPIQQAQLPVEPQSISTKPQTPFMVENAAKPILEPQKEVVIDIDASSRDVVVSGDASPVDFEAEVEIPEEELEDLQQLHVLWKEDNPHKPRATIKLFERLQEVTQKLSVIGTSIAKDVEKIKIRIWLPPEPQDNFVLVESTTGSGNMGSSEGSGSLVNKDVSKMDGSSIWWILLLWVIVPLAGLLLLDRKFRRNFFKFVIVISRKMMTQLSARSWKAKRLFWRAFQ